MNGLRKWIWVIVVVGVLMSGLYWAGFFKAFQAPPVTITPRNGSFVSSSNPKISGDWKLFPFAAIDVKQAWLDGKDITSGVTVSEGGFSCISPDELKEGKHTFRFTATYRFIVTKPMGKRLSFTVDTVPPPIELTNGAEMVASSGPRVVVGGKTEPGSSLTASFGGRRLADPKVYYAGSFWLGINIDLEKPVSELKIKAKDRAGNISSKTFEVLVDQDDPRIVSFSPVSTEKKNSFLKTNQPVIEVGLEEKTSAIEQVRIWIDGIEFSPEYTGPNKQKAVVTPGTLAEGTHNIEVRANDLAHNLVAASWSFTIDSTETFGNNLLDPGAVGADVKELQARLMAAGAGLKYADGTYKQATMDVVITFQKANNLQLTGHVGPAELSLLKPQKLDTSGGPLPGARIELSVSKRSLTLYNGTQVVKIYPVAVGMGGRFATPTGHFYIKKKEINPTWFPPDWADTTEPVRPGPNNPLGNRRLLLNITSYGIHGTNRPSSIGKAVTHGCIRMYPSDILELFEVVSVGTKVDIIR